MEISYVSFENIRNYVLLLETPMLPLHENSSGIVACVCVIPITPKKVGVFRFRACGKDTLTLETVQAPNVWSVSVAEPVPSS